MNELGAEKAPGKFTPNIMGHIEQEELKKEAALMNMLQRDASEVAPSGFTQKVMAGIPRPVPVSSPVIGKMGWVVIGLAMIAMVVLVFTGGSATAGVESSGWWSSFTNSLDEFSFDIQIPGILTALLLGISGLMLVDQLLKPKAY